MKTSMLRSIAAFALVSASLCSSALADGKAIYTGGEKGAYHSQFCPPLPQALTKAYFQGYACTTSAGTVENIANVKANPSNLAFVQFDVFAALAADIPELAKSIAVIRTDIAKEGLWMVTKNDALPDFGSVLGFARRVPFVLPPEASGATATFKYLQSLDPSGLGRAKNVTHVDSGSAVIDAVASGTNGEVGFFVQFPDPKNANFAKIAKAQLKVIPVISREILRAQVAGQSVYEPCIFKVAEDGWIKSAEEFSTACTAVGLITGKPDGIVDENAKLDQEDLIKKITSIPAEDLLPKDDQMASIIKGFKKLTAAQAEKAMAAAEDAKKKMMEKIQ